DASQPALFPFQPAQMIAFGNTFVPSVDWSSCGIHAAPITPPTVTYAQIQAIWNNNCSGCHSPGGSGASATGLVLDDPSHGNIVNVTASELPTKKRILPGTPLQSFLF